MKPAHLGEQAALVGKCQSCRQAGQVEKPGVAGGLLLMCRADGLPEVTRAHWSCQRYEYEPGSLG